MATPHNLARSPSLDFWLNSKFGKRRNTVCTRKGYAASVSQLTLATAAQYFSFFKLKKWGKKDGCGSQTQSRGVATMKTLVLLRHGESEWNLENRFTGWTDVDLTPKGIEEAKAAGQLMKAQGFRFDLAYTSCLKRANHTLALALGEMGEENIPAVRSWKLNERHYGALQSLSKAETAKKYGEEHVHIWRRSFDVQPPALMPEDDRSPARHPFMPMCPSRSCR